jgi:hypothetical protein
VVNLILYTVSCIGLCFILKYGSILSFFRNKLSTCNYFKELFSCSLCLGFWAGVFTGFLSPYPVIVFATYGAAVCWYADHLLDLIIVLIEKNK